MALAYDTDTNQLVIRKALPAHMHQTAKPKRAYWQLFRFANYIGSASTAGTPGSCISIFSMSKKRPAQQASVNRPVSLCLELIRTLQLVLSANSTRELIELAKLTTCGS